jgi:hypothetical protein
MRNQDLRDFDFTSASICLSKAIEIWLEETIVTPLTDIAAIRPLLKNAGGKVIFPHKATIGDVSHFLAEIGLRSTGGWRRVDIAKLFPSILPQDFNELSGDLETIRLSYRNGWAHKDPMSQAVYVNFRDYAVEFFNQWVPRWKKAN